MSQDQGRMYEAQTSLGRLNNSQKAEWVSGLPVRSQSCERQAVLPVEEKWEDSLSLHAFVMCYHACND